MNPPVPKKKKEPESWPAILKSWRSTRNLTQREAAQLADVTVSAYQKWEQGVSTPAMKNIRLLKEILCP